MSETTETIEKHIASVQLNLEKIILETLERYKKHDQSKLQEPEISLWEKMDQEKRYPYGTKEYFDKMERNKEVFDLHYKANSHHPEHFQNGISDMDLVDLTEMLCDWFAYKQNVSYKEASELIDKQAKRFNMSEDITNVLKNTVLNYFVSIGTIDI